MEIEMSLLQSVSEIVERHEAKQKAEGELYNVFQIINIEHDECRFHTRIIYDLLNPNGLHGNGDLFLRLFVEQFGPSDFKMGSVKVEKEKFLGPIDETYSNGGAVDIAITNNWGQAIFIENKINARDQLKQLVRYYNYGRLHYNTEAFRLIYLTPNGREPKNYSHERLEKNKHFHCIGYKSDIINWLEKCMCEAEQKPILKYTLKQYINSLKKITGQTLSYKMQEEIRSEVLKSKEIYEAAVQIRDILNSLEDKLNKKLCEIHSEIRSKLLPNTDLHIVQMESFSNAFTFEIRYDNLNAIVELGYDNGTIYHGARDENNLTSSVGIQIKNQLYSGEDDLRFSYDTEVYTIIESVNKLVADIIDILKNANNAEMPNQ